MPTKINLGCGPVGRPDWINIDWGILAILHKCPLLEKIMLRLKIFPAGYSVSWPKNLRLHNCKKKLPFADDSADYIYASHFLEHLKRFEAQRLLKDCLRVLKKGGVIRIAVPDLETLARKYLEKDAQYFKRIYSLMNFGREYQGKDPLLLADVLMDNFYPASYRSRPAGIGKVMSIFMRPHCWMYDYESLSSLLAEAGFKNIQRTAFRDGRTPDLAYLDVFPEMSLYLEAQK